MSVATSRVLFSRALTVLVLCTAAGAQDANAFGKEPAVRPSTRIAWADVDGDGLADLYLTRSGEADRLLRNLGDGSFEDATVQAGLAQNGGSRTVLFEDFGKDGDPDLVLVGAAGDLRIYRGLPGAAFVDVTSELGLGKVSGLLDAVWVDYDGDGLPDLQLETARGEPLLFHNGRGVAFESVDLGVVFETVIPAAVSVEEKEENSAEEVVPSTPGGRRLVTGSGSGSGNLTAGNVEAAVAEALGPFFGLGGIVICAAAVEDAANPGNCLPASSDPMLGALYPLSADFYIDSSGYVGMGTTAPTTKLTVSDSSLGEVSAVRALGPLGPTRGYLGAQGADDFDGIATADWVGQEMGVVGISTGGSDTDNYGVFGHSNGVGVRAEYSGDPFFNFAELGTNGIGIIADGTTRAAEFLSEVQINSGNLEMMTGDMHMMYGSMNLDLGTVTLGTGDFVLENGALVGTEFMANPILDLDHEGAPAQVVTIDRNTSAAAGNDLLELTTEATSDALSQFIECELGVGNVKFRVDADGDVFADGAFTGPADFSEMLRVSTGAATIEPGDLVVIDPFQPRAVKRSASARSTLVAGVYSTRPGFVGSERDWEQSSFSGEATPFGLEDMAELYDEVPVAVVGIVPCKVTAANGPIRPGDLLVSSNLPGHAMRDEHPTPGTIVGKALEALPSGTGVIRILVTLQ